MSPQPRATDPHCMENSDMVVFVVPALFIRSVAQRVKPFLTKDTILVNASKGLEEETFLTMSQIIQSEYPENAVGVITGPSHAEEVGLHRDTPPSTSRPSVPMALLSI